ncbi:tetratricopeptide repeat protein [Clostridium vincentii]|uniref:Beta-barrel assembly-enhancing protease n=1 Tax=Clostridium vincentii TaxID=52704 RepID=A0A2T0BBS4_9CLOT|nr:tetratricopeptide repeat protein [Clostridium vincentii]PRR81283.1 Beta-barrel assembly-enhancing protease [Clostridium vincentii]
MSKDLNDDKMKSGNDGSTYRKFINKNPEIESAIAMFLVMLFAVSVIAMCKSAQGDAAVVTSITENPAEQYFYEKEYDKAIEEYTKLQEEEEWPLNLVKEADVYSVRGEYKISNRLLNEASQKRNKIIDEQGRAEYEDLDGELGNYIAFTALMNGDYKKALEYGEVFLEDNKDDKELKRTLFAIYLTNGNKEKAKEILTNYNIDEKASYDLALYGKMNMLVDNYDVAFSNLKDSWNKNKDEIKVFDIIEEMAEGNMEDTINKITELSEENPEEKVYKVWLAKCYSMDESKTDKGIELIEELKDEDLGNSMFSSISAEIEKNAGNTEESDAIMKSIIGKKEKTYVDYNIESQYYFDNKEYDKALEACKQSILKNGDYLDNYAVLMPDIMIKKKQVELAEPYFRTALRKEPFNSRLISNIADYYNSTAKDINTAYPYYNLAVALNPKDDTIYYSMALSDLNNNKSEEAIVQLKKAIELKGNEITYHNTLSVIYFNNKKMDNSIEEIRAAYEIDNNNIMALNNAGCYYLSNTDEIERGVDNLLGAYEKMDNNVDSETRSTITINYEKAKQYLKDYNDNKSNATKPELQMLY